MLSPTTAAHRHRGTPGVGQRARAVRRVRWLNVATIGWNSLEGVVAVAAGLAAGSVSLAGFGFDSAIEVSPLWS
jgi:hypothetical protein